MKLLDWVIKTETGRDLRISEGGTSGMTARDVPWLRITRAVICAALEITDTNQKVHILKVRKNLFIFAWCVCV